MTEDEHDAWCHASHTEYDDKTVVTLSGRAK